MNTLIAFIDKERGLSFDGRRTTWDKELVISLVETYRRLSGDKYTINKLRATILNNKATANLANELRVISNSKYVKYHKNVIVELQSENELRKLINNTKNILLYVWDCEYPSTIKFPELDDTWELISTEIVNSSIHKKVAKYFYSKKV